MFFLQAEDGIRARDVTGVQTCALPILQNFAPNQSWLNRTVLGVGLTSLFSDWSHETATAVLPARSEERPCRERESIDGGAGAVRSKRLAARAGTGAERR